jgi:hypothetical protein
VLEEMHKNPKSLEMEDDSDDLDGMEDGDAGTEEQGDYMQEDRDCNSKDKGADMSFTTNQTEQQGGNKKSLLKKNNVSSHGVDKDLQIDENADVMALEELSPDARSDGDQYEMDGGDTPSLSGTYKCGGEVY